jgi:hypothetical protein
VAAAVSGFAKNSKKIDQEVTGPAIEMKKAAAREAEESGGEKCRILRFSGGIAYRCFKGRQKYF